MSFSGGDFSADSIRAYVHSRKEEDAARERAHQEAQAAERERLREAFLEREIHPDVMARLGAVIRKAVDAGEKEVMLFQFPSEWLPDQGRGLTSHDPEWHQKLDGFPKRAWDYFAKELAPRGFQLRARILDFPGGMPGDVGFFLGWRRPEEE